MLTPIMSAVAAQYHGVQFYGEEKNLYDTVASFLAQGLIQGEPALIVATGRHTVGILDHLQYRMIDIKRAQRMGDLIAFDAHRLIEKVAPTDVPDDARIHETVQEVMSVFAARRARSTPVRVFGEMVDLCWKEGRYDTALRIEVCWNDLLKRYRMPTLCGYGMRHFLSDPMLLDEVCRQHTHVVPARLAH
jgi:hypothetical protein